MNTIIENQIPPMTDPLGRFWKQPDREEILIDDNDALMTLAAFNKLADYSWSSPTGVYDGKMWKSKIDGQWFLKWFGPHPDPTQATINKRAIIIA